MSLRGYLQNIYVTSGEVHRWLPIFSRPHCVLATALTPSGALAKAALRMSTDSRRLSILTAHEIDDLYGLPRFTEDDRRLHFDPSSTERDLVDGVRTMSAAVHLILQLGYFKDKCQFFVFAREAVMGDLDLRRHFPARATPKSNHFPNRRAWSSSRSSSSRSATGSAMPPPRRNWNRRRSVSRDSQRCPFSSCAKYDPNQSGAIDVHWPALVIEFARRSRVDAPALPSAHRFRCELGCPSRLRS